MKKAFYLLFGIVLTFGMMSCGKDDPDPRRNGGGGNGGDPEQEAYTFKANDCWAGYYGDHLGYGTGVYLVQLTQGTVDDNGDLTGVGNSIMLAISEKLLSDTKNLVLPEGTFKANGNTRNSFTLYNGLNSDDQYSSWLEVWPSGESESEYYFIDDGTLTIKKSSNGKYSITADVDVFYYDNNDKTHSAGQVIATYNGSVTVVDCTEENGGGGGDENPYEPYTKDVNLGTMTDMDCFFYNFTESLLGNYYMKLYNVTFDSDGYVNSTGDILTLDLYTDYSDDPNLNLLNGTFRVAELEEFEENTFQPGFVYWDEDEEDYQWWGTYVDEVVKSEGSYVYGRSGLITDGTIEVSHDGDKLIVQFNLLTENGKKVTGTYNGIPNVEDEGDLAWTKARKTKAKKTSQLMPFSKYNRVKAHPSRRHTSVQIHSAQGLIK